jgi:hypothetical protein
LKKAKKQREELSAERLRELSTTPRVRPFDERRRPPPPRKFSEVDNTDPAFDFERVPATRGGGKKGRRPVGSDYEDFSGDVSAPLMEAPPSGDLNAGEFDEVDDVEEETVTTTIPPLEQAQFDVVREQFEVARKEITTEFSNFNRRLPVAGGSYASMTIGVPGSGPVAAPEPSMSLTGFAAGNLQSPALHGKVTSSEGLGGRHERPSSAGGSTSSKTASHKDVFNFSLPEDPAFPGSLEAVIHHNPFRQNFEELNASRIADGGSSGRVAIRSCVLTIFENEQPAKSFAQHFSARCLRQVWQNSVILFYSPEITFAISFCNS